MPSSDSMVVWRCSSASEPLPASMQIAVSLSRMRYPEQALPGTGYGVAVPRIVSCILPIVQCLAVSAYSSPVIHSVIAAQRLVTEQAAEEHPTCFPRA